MFNRTRLGQIFDLASILDLHAGRYAGSNAGGAGCSFLSGTGGRVVFIVVLISPAYARQSSELGSTVYWLDIYVSAVLLRHPRWLYPVNRWKYI